MGWTAYYQVVRETPLTDAEIAKVAELVRKQLKAPWDGEAFFVKIAREARPDHVVAAGWNKLAMSTESGDSERLEAALDELAAILGGELRVRDDFGAFKRGGNLVDLSSSELTDARDLVAAPPVVVAGDDVDSLIDAMIACEEWAQKDVFRERLKTKPAFDVAQAILPRYATLGKQYEVRNVLSDALERLDDPTRVAAAFLDAWRNPGGTYHWHDMHFPDAFLVAIAQLPDVVAQWTADIAKGTAPDQSELVYRCAERSIDFLGQTGHFRPIFDVIRTLRGKSLAFNVDHHVVFPAHRALSNRKDPRAVPTLLHFIATGKMRGWIPHYIDTVIELAPDRARPYALELARRGHYRKYAIEWMRKLGGREELALADQLEARGRASVFTRAIDGDLATRQDALAEIHKQKDPSTYLSLVYAEALDKFLRAPTEYPGLPFSWWDWKDLLEGDGIQGTTAKKLKWFELVGKHRLGPQTIWPEVVDIEKLGAAKVAERYPSEILSVPRDELAALEAEEAAIIAAS